MTLPLHTLDVLCPMHAAVSGSGHIRRTGPTLAKLRLDGLVGRRFLEVFEVQRPRGLKSMSALLNAAGRKLHLRLRDTPQTALKAVLVPDGAGGGVVNFSFGISLVEAVSEYALTNHDFDPTDLSVEMLYLIEAKSAAMAATHRLNTRLQVAWEAAEEQAMTDTLTGLKNRRALDHILTRMSQTQGDFALMHLDLDFFKAVNDQYGHAAGDLVLQESARRMREHLRRDDVIARIGGDEFILVFEGLTERDRLSQMAARLIRALERPVMYGTVACCISGSVGIALRHRGDDGLPDALIAAADGALYGAKAAGRGCYRFASDSFVHGSEKSLEKGVDPPGRPE